MRTTCTRPGCQRRHYAKGLCNVHYRRAAEGWGDRIDEPIIPRGDAIPRSLEFCSVDGCRRVPHAGGLCAAHYRRKLRGVPLTSLVGEGRTAGDVSDPTVRVDSKFWVPVWAYHAIEMEACATGLTVPEIVRRAVEEWAQSRRQHSEAA